MINEIISKVLKEDRFLKTAIDFPNQGAFDQYMKNHPDADPRHHRVVENEKPDISEKIEKKKNELKEQPAEKSDISKKLEDKKNELSQSNNEYDKLYSEHKSKMNDNLSKYDDSNIVLKTEKSTEELNSKNYKKYKQSIVSNAKLVIKKYQKALAKDTIERVDDELGRLTDSIEKGINDGSIKVSAEKVDALIQDQMKNLIHQEIETHRRALGDHGIRHILGNSKNTHKIMDQLELGGKKFSGAERLAASLTQLNHDVGYTAGEAATSVKGTKRHQEFSEKLFEKEKQKYSEVLGKDLADKTQHWIKTHDAVDYNWNDNPIVSAIRLADNTSLFAEDKVPALFFRSQSATKTLGKMRLAMSLGKDYKSYAKELENDIDKMEVSEIEKEELKNAVNELNDYGINDVLARMSGKLNGYKFDKEKGIMEVDLAESPEFDIIQKTFNIGQNKFLSFIKDHDENDPSLRENVDERHTVLKDKSGKSIIQVNVSESENKKTDNVELENYLKKTVRYDLGEVRKLLDPPPNFEKMKNHKIKDKLTGTELKLYDRIIMLAEKKMSSIKDKKYLEFTNDDKKMINKFQGLLSKFPPVSSELEVLND